MTDTPTPTQADRDAAAKLAKWLTQAQKNWGGQEIWFRPSFPDEVREGTWDNHDWVQAFARHRLATLDAAIEVVRDLVLQDPLDDAAYITIAEHVVAALEALKGGE